MTARTIGRGFAAAVLGLATATAAHAQGGMKPLVPGQRVHATITTEDPRFKERGPFHAYRFEAKAGTRYQVSMRSSAFDSYLWVARSVGGLTEEMQNDDDSGGGQDARLRFRVPTGGTYIIVAQALDAAGTGAYDLQVEELGPTPPASAVAVALGEVKEGRIDDASPMLDEEGGERPYQLYSFTGRGQRVRVTVRSGNFDATVKVTRVTATGEEQVGTDDDSGGGSDAMLAFTANGEFRIYAAPLDGSRMGAFTVGVSEVQVRPVVSRALTVGEQVSGSIDAEDAELDDGRNFDQYTITGRPGERFTVTLRSSAFDAYLDWGQIGVTGWQSEANDDDSAGDTDAKLDITLPAEGNFVLRAMPLEKGRSGSYTIVVERRVAK